MLKYYQMNIAPLRDEAVFWKKIRLVRPGRREKILACHAQDDRCRSLAAGLLLIEALRQEGISYADASFSYGKNGKPFLRDGGIHFSLSHAGELAFCALSDCEVGADIEQLSRFDGKEAGGRMERIARRILNEEEWQLWDQDPSGEALVLLWTEKESYVKYTGEGRSRDFSSVDTLHGAEFSHPEVPEGYVCSVCTAT
jgi:4'-phosphopantetheinyl transferase